MRLSLKVQKHDPRAPIETSVRDEDGESNLS